jgi:hypothetical protein
MPSEPIKRGALNYPWTLHTAILEALKGRSQTQWIVEAMQEKLEREKKAGLI